MPRFQASVLVATLCFLLLASASCLRDAGDSDCYQNLRLPLPPPLSAIPETLSTPGLRLVLEASLNRDFMPISPAGGRPLGCSVRVVEIDSLPVPADLEVLQLWVIKDQEFWGTTVSHERSGPDEPPFMTSAQAGCGPKWEPGVFVDVVVRLRHQNRIDWYLKGQAWIDSSE